jgi:hypothetical protein
MNDLMIDLETLSTQNDAYIISIGACMFDIQTGEIGALFSQHIEWSNTFNGHIDAKTVQMWLGQSEQATNAIINNKAAVNLPNAIVGLKDFVRDLKPKTLWSNGANFDLVIVRNTFSRLNHITPWQFRQERDTRTLVDIAERITGINAAKTTEFIGTKHDALADAIHQAKYISQAFNMIKTYTQTTL